MPDRDLVLSGINWHYYFQNNLATLSAAVLWILDYGDTLTAEIRTFWTRKTKISLPMVIFIVGRYCMLIWVCMCMTYLVPGDTPDRFCAITIYPAVIALVLGVLCTNILLLMRAYALCRCDRRILILGLVISVARFACMLYFNVAAEYTTSSGNGAAILPRCIVVFRAGDKDAARLLASFRLISPVLAIALDTLVLVAILSSTLRHIRDMRKLRQGGLVERIVKDSVLYYVVVLILAILLTVPDTVQVIGAPIGAAETLGQLVEPFYNLVPNMLASRIVLNARTYEGSLPSTLSLQQPGSGHEVRFARVVGSIGAPLQSTLYDSDLELECLEEPQA